MTARGNFLPPARARRSYERDPTLGVRAHAIRARAAVLEMAHQFELCCGVYSAAPDSIDMRSLATAADVLARARAAVTRVRAVRASRAAAWTRLRQHVHLAGITALRARASGTPITIVDRKAVREKRAFSSMKVRVCGGACASNGPR